MIHAKSESFSTQFSPKVRKLSDLGSLFKGPHHHTPPYFYHGRISIVRFSHHASQVYHVPERVFVPESSRYHEPQMGRQQKWEGFCLGWRPSNHVAWVFERGSDFEI